MPALSDTDAVQMSEEELLSNGYPPRPNPEKTPHAYSVWRRAFSIPRELVEPVRVANPDIRHDLNKVSHAPATGSSTNWSGFVLNTGGPYCVVTGAWYVPSVYSRYERENNITTYSCSWVGLDGWGTTDLVQAGTEQDSLDIHDLTFSNYYAWTEFLPQEPFEQIVQDFPVYPGDEMYVSVWMGDVKSRLDLAGTDGVFWLTNLTTSKHTILTSPRGSTVVSGSTAEWIVERPTVSGSFLI